jgi:Ca2+-binding RTX toxin-like protein
VGDNGNDTILGWEGNDTIWGGIGSNSLDGGDDDDLFHAQNGTADTINGGKGDDEANVDMIDVVDNVEVVNY